MANVKWIKITVDMFDDEKIKIIQSMPDGDALLIIWIKLITLAGKTNDGGYIYISESMPYTDEMLSIIMNKPLLTIRLAIDTFTQLGMIENDEKGIYLLNFEKHQSLDKLEKIREQNRLRKQRQREREKQQLLENVTSHEKVTQSHAIDIDKEEDKEIDNNKRKKVSKKESNYDNIINSMVQDDDIKNTIYEFIKMRKLIKKPMTDRALTMLINKLNKLSSDKETQIKILDKSILNNWQDIYEYKEDVSNNNKRKEIVPDWMNKDIQKQEISKEEQEEMEGMLKEFKDPQLDERVAALKERLKS